MKRLGRVVGNLFAMALAVVALQTVAAETQLGGRDFNHMTTGFPLSGGHATAACETCHVGGVFKGTPRTCDGCHALGKRIVATPKSTNHIVTDAQCDTCHFNTSTWLGARFNHATATPGQCITCHNGRVAAGKHARHVATVNSCDQCHRTSSWIPASWNHTGGQYAAQDCSVCHNASGPGRNLSAGHLPMSMPPVSFVGNCRTCHTNFYTFYSHYYNHAGAPLTCQTCHGTYNAPVYTNVRAPSAAIHSVLPSLPVTTTCNSCHKSYGAWTGKFDHVGATQCSLCHSGTYATYGIRGKSANHIAYSGAPECSTCHTTSSWANTLKGAALHTTYLAGQACVTCHAAGSRIIGGGKMGSHEGFTGSTPDCSSSGCHAPLGRKGTAYVRWH